MPTATRTAVDRIVRTYLAATDQQARDGAAWYDEARAIATDLAAANDVTLDTAAAVLAHLSPRTTWARNVAGAWSLMTRGTAPLCLGANVDRARAALGSPDPLGTLNGPKTLRFARNILGDRDAVTVDVWAARVALGPRDGRLTATEYVALERAYQLAARRLGVDPVTVQATTWVVARTGSGRALRGRYRLAA